MTELIKRDLVIDKLKQGYFDKNLQQAKDDPCVIDAMIDWSIRQVKELPIYNPWHTGTPTEEGEYLIKYRYPQHGVSYDVAQYPAPIWEMNIIEKWQEIEETSK